MPRLTALLFAVLVLVVPAGAHAQTHAKADDVLVFEPTPTLSVYRSKHYRIYTTLSKRETVPYGRHIDAVYDQYQRRFRSFSPKRVEPMPLYLFRTEQQYNRFLAEHDIDATHSGGMFFVTHKLEGLATWAGKRSRRRTFEVLQHEGFHQFAWHAIGPRLPVWLNEGLAQYFEGAVIAGGKMSLGMARGPRITKVREAIKAGKALPLDKLTELTSKSWSQTLREKADHSSLLYAQSWSVAYYLVHGEDGKHQKKLLEYLERLSKGERPGQAMLMAFGKNGLGAIEADWKRYALKQQPEAIAEATDRLEFLGTGLRLLAEQGADMPKDLDELRKTLQKYGFKLRRSEMGVTRNLSADHDKLFRFKSGSSDQAFVLIKPERSGLPPRITAPGLKPEPMLVWYRDKDGKLVQDIAYR